MNKESFIALKDEILNLPGLNYFDKILLAKIVSLDNSKRNCYANNRYFANLLGCSTTYVSRSISKLKRLSYVFIYIDRFHGNKRQIKSLLNSCSPIGKTRVQSPQSPSFKHNKDYKKELNKEVSNNLAHFEILKINYPNEISDLIRKYKMDKEELKRCIDQFNHKFMAYLKVSIKMFESYLSKWYSNIPKVQNVKKYREL